MSRVALEQRFLGLYTTSAYKASPREIPMLREKYQAVLDRSGFPPDSHDAKELVDFLEKRGIDLDSKARPPEANEPSKSNHA